MGYRLGRIIRSVAGRLSVAAVLLGSLGLVAGTMDAGAQDKKDWPQRMTFATGPTGGFGYTMGAPWAATVGAALGVPVSPESTSGIPTNVQMIQEKKAEAAVGTSDVVVMGWRGEDYAKGKKLQDVRTMMMFVPFVFQMYTPADSGINSLQDLNGKVVNPSRAGSQTDVVFRAMVKTFGLKPKQITNLSPAQANDLMADGRVDVAIGAGGVPHPAASQYEARSAIRLVGLTAEEVEKFLSDNPQLSRMVVPAGSFKGQEQDIITVGSYTMFITHKDLPDSLVYAMVKATFDSKADLANAYKAYEKLDAKSILESPIPVHPGAIKYFEEQGIAIPDKLKQG